MRKMKILIVDDDEVLLDTFKNGLSAEGHHCNTATGAIPALELIEKESFHIMIADIIMPDMDGLELTKRVKKMRPEVSTIIITGHIEDFPYDLAIEAGAADFMKKPFTLKELIARINHVQLQEELRKREEELTRKVKELEEFYEIAVGRELRMKELKKEIERLKKKLEKGSR